MGLLDRITSAFSGRAIEVPDEDIDVLERDYAIAARETMHLGNIPSNPLVGSVMSAPKRQRGRGNREALTADAQHVLSIFNQAESGRIARLIDLYKDASRTDPRLATVRRTRMLAIIGRSWTMKPPPGKEDDETAKRVAADMTSVFNETRGLSSLIGKLAQGALDHVAVLEHDWRTNTRGWTVSQPGWRHSNRFCWNDDIELAILDAGMTYPGIPCGSFKNQFIIHAPSAGEADYPWRTGPMASIVMLSLIKRYGTAWWLKMLERWGQPQVYAVLPAGSSQLIADVKEMLRKISTDWRAVLTGNVEIKSIPASAMAGLHKEFIEWADVTIAIAILGQNLTTEVSAGSFAAAMAHNNVRLDILAADLIELAETITDQWIRPTVAYNWPGLPCPFFEFTLQPKGEITSADYMTGAFRTDEYRNSKGWDAESDGRGDRYYQPTGTFNVPQPGQPPGTPIAAAPPGGAAAASPFRQESSRTGSPSTNPLAQALTRRSEDPAR